MGAGNITKIAFSCGYYSTASTTTRNITVYMSNTTKSSFEGKSDWETTVGFNDNYKVYEGTYTVTVNSVCEIILDTPFAYDGTSNILVCINDNTGDWASGYKFYTNDNGDNSKNTALSIYNDYTSYTSNNPGQASAIGHSAHIKFTWESSASGDDCVPAVPTNLQAEIVDHQSINLTWDDAENALKYQVWQRDKEDMIAEIEETEFLVEGLSDNTGYCFTVKSVCYKNTSDASDEVCAVTEELQVPATPANLTATDITHNSVTLTWDDVKYAETYTVSYTGGTISVTENTCDVTGLTPETKYTFSVTANNTKGSSSAAEVSATTLEAPKERTLVFELIDSYGDGWNSNYLRVYFNDEEITSYTISSGTSANYELIVPQGTKVKIVYDDSSGSYQYENSFTIYYKDGTLINGQEKISGTGTSFTVAEFVYGPLLLVEASSYFISPDQTTILTATAIEFDGDVTYSWSLNGEIVGTDATYTFTPSTTGEYTFTCTVGTIEKSVTINVLANPFAGKQFRVKVMQGTYAGSYLDVYNDNGTIGVESKTERNTQIFAIEKIGENQYYLKTADGYYIKCETGSGWWNVHAYNTYDKTPLVFEYTGGEQFYIKDYDKMTGNSQTGDNNNPNNCYFKVENQKVYCDAPSSYTNTETSYITTWSLEEVLPSPENLAIVGGEKNQLYPGETTEISWNALDGAASYNVYVNDVKFNTEVVGGLSYELVNLPYGMNTIAVAAVFENGSESGMSNTVTVQMAGTFPLTIKVQDKNGNAVAGAKIFIEGTDEYYNNVKFEGVVTNENGEWYKEDMPLLYESFGYNGNVSAEPFEIGQINNLYESYIENATPYTHTVVMYLPTIYARTEKESYDANEDIVLFWDAIDPEYVDGYNVYVNDEEDPRNTELLTSAIYTLEGGLPESGNISVTAVYKDYGESEKGYGYVIINKYEYVILSGTVTDDANNRIAGAEVVVEGRDMKWMEQRYTTLTNADGTFELEVLPSYEWDESAWYSVSVSKYGYSSYKSTEKYKAVVDSDIILDAIVLTANADVTFTVTATEEENGNVTVTWEAPEGATQYNVFRKDATEAVVKLTEAPITEQEYLATDWNELSNGTYQYGVSAFVGGGSETLLNESFENNGTNIPTGWVASSNFVITNGHNNTENGAYAINIMTTSSGNSTKTLKSPAITIDGSAQLSFYYKNFNEMYSYYGTMNIKVESDGETENIYVISSTYDKTDFQQVTLSLNEYMGKTVNIIFETVTYLYSTFVIDDIVVSVSSSPVETSINWASPLTKNDANVFTDTGEWTSVDNWSNGVPADGANVFIEGDVTIASNVNVNNMTINGGSVTIDKGASLIVEGTLVNEAAENLVINDGAQIFQNNEGIPATFVMNINNWTDNENAWQFIASPLLDASLFSHATGNYDLFKYIGYYDLEWYNHKLHAAGFGSTFEQGVGYLASHETANTIVMTGTLNNKNTHTWYSYIFTYDYEGVKDVASFNLLGNPFTFNMKWSEVVSTGLVNGYAYLNENGGYETAVDGEIAVGDAFFVKAKSADAQMSYGEELRGAKAEQSEYINLIASGKAGRDNVIINLAGKQEGFTKMQNFNESIATVYVAEDNTRYGIYNCNSDIEEVVVSFNAKDMGDYTIAAVAEGGFSSVVLVDLFTGIETDLLTSGYTFAAKSGDNAERFVVRFSYSQESAMDSNFVYQSGEDLIIMAEGALQIVDMLGRVVYYSEVATDVTRVNVSNFDNAAYIVRVVNGEGVKTQKVVIY